MTGENKNEFYVEIWWISWEGPAGILVPFEEYSLLATFSLVWLAANKDYQAINQGILLTFLADSWVDWQTN